MSLAPHVIRVASAAVRRVPFNRGRWRLAHEMSRLRRLELDFTFACPRLGISWSAAAFPDLLTRYMLFEGCYQDDVVVAMQALLRPGDVFLDIGAHHGLMSVIARRLVGSSGLVVAFEPNPQARRHLVRHLEINGFGDVRVESLALADAPGIADFFVQDGDVSWNSSLVRGFVDPEQRIEPMRIEVDSLDRFCEARAIVPSMIKIDVEGGEIAVLQGARRVIEEHRPALVLELNPKSASAAGTTIETIVQWLRRLGYRLSVLERDWRGFHRFERQTPFEADVHIRTDDLRNIVCQQ